MTKREIPRMTDEDMKLLAKGIVDGHVFLMNDCPPDLIGSVFLPVGLGGLADVDAATVGMVCEWMDKAGERGINGYPMFLSCQVIHVEDWEVVRTRALKIAEAVAEAMK